MKCLNCGRSFISRRTIFDLFSNTNLLVCDKCYMRYLPKPTISYVPIDNGKITIISLYSYKNKPQNLMSFSQEFVRIYLGLVSKNYLVIPYDYLFLTENDLNYLELINGLIKQNIVLLTYVDKT